LEVAGGRDTSTRVHAAWPFPPSQGSPLFLLPDLKRPNGRTRPRLRQPESRIEIQPAAVKSLPGAVHPAITRTGSKGIVVIGANGFRKQLDVQAPKAS